MIHYTPKDIQRFWSKVNIGNPDECWEWQASRGKKGYGHIGFGTRKEPKMLQSHRVAWELTYGKIPDGLFVCHHCDNPSCCNPAHLFIGTNQDNVNDKMFKNRYRCLEGETHPNSKITEDKVRYIRKKYAQGMISLKSLSLEVGIGVSQTKRIVDRKSWQHVK